MSVPFNAGSVPIERVRGRAGQVMRNRHLNAQPLCVICLKQGRLSHAVELDHIIALVNGGTNADSNFQCLCKACHQDKTARDLGYSAKVRTGLDGWPS